jgi:hypothetical protein
VYSQGSGKDINIDFHKFASWGNLFTQLDCGQCSNLYLSSGKEGKGPHGGPWNTFWNIRGEPSEYYMTKFCCGGSDLCCPNGWPYPRMGFSTPQIPGFAPRLTFVGIMGLNLPVKNWGKEGVTPLGPGWLIETKPPYGLQPQNLYFAMAATRAARLKNP